jgi:hypothetical protein
VHDISEIVYMAIKETKSASLKQEQQLSNAINPYFFI